MKTVTKHRANHPLHAVLTLLTCGFWAPVWILASVAGRKTVSWSPDPGGTQNPYFLHGQQPVPLPAPEGWTWNPYTGSWVRHG